MRVSFIAFLVVTSSSLFAVDPLVGKKFNHCDTDSKYHDWYYALEYSLKNEEFELEVFRDKDAKGRRGKSQFAIARFWKYEINGDEISTTLKEVRVIVTNKNLIAPFNKNQV